MLSSRAVDEKALSPRRWVDPLSALLIDRVDRRAPTEAARRSAYGILEGWVGLCLNAVLFVVKLVLGTSIGSVALIADAVHTLADSVTSAVLIIASGIARRPADSEHPYGHGRVEVVAAVVIAVLLGVAGVEFLRSSIERMLDPDPIVAGWAIVAALVVMAATKEWNARFASTLARKSGSAAIEADSWHHRSDVFATLLVAVGIVGAKYGFPILDAIMGIGVSLIILGTALQLARRSISPLIGEAPTKAEIAQVAEAAMRVEGVEGVHDIVIHSYGNVRLVTLHIEVSATESPMSAHALAEKVMHLVGEGRKGHVVVHVDPIDRDHPRYEPIRQAVHDIVAADERLQSFHDLRVGGEPSCLFVKLDLVMVPDAGNPETIERELNETIRRTTGAATVEASIEPLFAFSSDA